MTNRKRYSIEFQANAVKLVLMEGYSVAEASRKLGIDYSVLWRWKKKLQKIIYADTQLKKPDDTFYQSIADLTAKLERVTEERNILMKALSHFIAKQE